MKKEHKVDQLFKAGMDDPDIPFNELDWQKMAEKLDASEVRRKPPFWIYAAVGTAAMLLVVFLLFLSDQNAALDKKKTNVSSRTKPLKQEQTPSFSDPVIPSAENKDLNYNEPDLGVALGRGLIAGKQLSKDPVGYAAVKMPMLDSVPAPPWGSRDAIANEKTPIRESDRKPPVNNTLSRTGKLTLTLLAAPDVTDSKTSIGTKISSNFGVLLTYPVSEKLSFSTGAIYARKLYDYGGSAATINGQPSAPWALNADCSVIDLPVNVNYQVLKKKNYSVQIHSGVSSYFMLKERYKYTNTNPDGKVQSTTLEVRNQNQHLLGVANLSVSFERKVSENVSVGVQPFLKLPLTGMGYYNYNLRSRGIAVSLSIKPFGAKKY